MSEAVQPMDTAEGPEVAKTAAEVPAEQPEQPAAAEQENEQPAAEPAAEKVEDKTEDKPMEKSPERVKERERSRERSRSRDRDRRRDREGDKDFRARSRSRSRDRRRRSRSRSRDRRRSRSRSRSPYDKSRSSHRSRRSRFEDDNDSDREERRKRAAAATAASGPPSGGYPAAPGADPMAALRAGNPALAGMDPATAQLVMRQQMMLQQQLMMAQQQAAVLQAQQVMSKATKAQTGNARLQEKQLKAQRELFVGNLAPGVGEQSLYQVFHSALIAAFPQAGQPGQEPVLKVALNGRFAFVEFRVPEYATAALQLSGQIALMGNTLKIARPASYVEMPMMGGGLPGMGGMPGQPAAAAAYPGPPAAFGAAPGGGPASAGAVAASGPASVSDPMALLIPTPFLCVTGMVTHDVLSSDEEYKEVSLAPSCACRSVLESCCGGRVARVMRAHAQHHKGPLRAGSTAFERGRVVRMHCTCVCFTRTRCWGAVSRVVVLCCCFWWHRGTRRCIAISHVWPHTRM
ncbi:hypothetical protein COO60DRAFT_1535770 [Scenedesmus sp. NREL 46B-D3]|nr:hypothetical protein COO60DRAFT_1535770 [Scenedesmus sp. NREL 46B-D3]